jgi:hypothetical protein
MKEQKSLPKLKLSATSGRAYVKYSKRITSDGCTVKDILDEIEKKKKLRKTEHKTSY